MEDSNINLSQLLETISLIIVNNDYRPLKIPNVYDLSLLYEDADKNQFYEYIDNSLIYKSALSYRLGFLINNNFKNVKHIFVDNKDIDYIESLSIYTYIELLKKDVDININTLTTIICIEYELIRLIYIFLEI